MFRTYGEAERAVNALESAGIPRSDMSVVGRQGVMPEAVTTEPVAEGAAVGATGGAIAGGLGGLLLGLGLITVPGIGPVLAAGTLATALATTAAGAGVGAAAGGVLGALAGLGLPKEDVELYAEGVKRGGVLVTAQARDDQVNEARRILQSHGAVDIRQSADQWRKAGWTGFDNTKPYTDNYPTI
jgi:hypothetical protein